MLIPRCQSFHLCMCLQNNVSFLERVELIGLGDFRIHLFIDNSQSRHCVELHFDMNAIHCDINVNRVISLLVGYVIRGVFSSFWLTNFILLVHMMRMLGSNVFVCRLLRTTGWCNVPNLFTFVAYRCLNL